MVTASTRVSQLVMWHLAAGLDWETIAQLSQNWANRYELTIAQESRRAPGYHGRRRDGSGPVPDHRPDAANEAIADEVTRLAGQDCTRPVGGARDFRSPGWAIGGRSRPIEGE